MKLDSQTASRPAPYLCAPASAVILTHAKDDIYLRSPESLCCLKSSYKLNVELWLCRCTDAFQKPFVPTCPCQLLPSSLLPGCPCRDREPLGGKGVGFSGLLKHRQTSQIQVCAEKKETASEWWGIGLWCLVVGKLWGLAQAHLWHFHLLNDFRHFVAGFVLRREGECDCCDGLMDTRRLLSFPSTCSLPFLGGHYCSLC